MARHDPKTEWRTCARCAYYHHRAFLEKACYFEDEYTRERLCYLIEAPLLDKHPWGVGCAICRMAKGKSAFARCRVRSLSLFRDRSKFARHAETAEHKRALQMWHSARAPSTAAQEEEQGGGDEAGLTAIEDPTTGIGYAHVLGVLAEVKRAGSG